MIKFNCDSWGLTFKHSFKMQTYWTEKHDLILKEEISKSPDNLANAFRKASKRLWNKKVSMCSARWYNVLSKQNKVFSLESNDCSIVNTKNSTTQEIKPKQKGIFIEVNKLESLPIEFLRELAVTKLVDVDKKKLIDMITEY